MAKSTTMIGQFVAVLFLARDLAHRAHLRTTGPGSFAAHEALGGFYPAITDLADKLIEVYQGCELTLLDIPLLDNEFPGEPEQSTKQFPKKKRRCRTSSTKSWPCTTARSTNCIF